MRTPCSPWFGRVLAGSIALASVSAFAIECLSLLHSNLMTVTVDFKKAAEKTNPPVPAEVRVQVFAAPNGNGFYATNGKSLGYVEASTGKFESLVEGQGTNYLNVRDSRSDILFGDFYRARVGKKTNRAARESRMAAENGGSGTSRIDEDKRLFFLDKRTRKVVYSPKLPVGAVGDTNWAESKSAFYPYAEKDVLHLVDVRTGAVRKLELPFVPTRMITLGEANAVVFLEPGKSPVVFDVVAGKVVTIPGLAKFKLPSAANPGGTYTLVVSGKRLAFRQPIFIPDAKVVTKELPEFWVDLGTKRVTAIRRPEAKYSFEQSAGDGTLDLLYNRNSFPPQNVTEEEMRVWIQKSAQELQTQHILVDNRTGRPLLTAGNFFQIREGRGQVMISQAAYGGRDGTRTNFYLFDTGTGELKPIESPEANGYVSSFAFDPKHDRWVVFVPSTGSSGVGGNPTLLLYSREGKIVERLPVKADMIAVGDRGQFVGLMSKEWSKGQTYVHLDTPDLSLEPRVPAEGWEKGSVRLGGLLTKEDAKAAYPELLAYFERKVYLDHPKTAAGAFMNLFSTSNMYAGHVLGAHPDLLATLKANPLDVSRMSARASLLQRRATKNFLAILQSGGSFAEANAAYFQALRPFLELTPKTKVEDVVDTIAESFKNQVMRENAELNDVFESKVYKIVRHSFSDNFPTKEGPLTDLTVTQENGELKLLALGSHGIEDGTKTRFGIELKELGKYKVPEDIGPNQVIARTEVAWVHNGERFTAKVLAKTASRTMSDIVKFADAPDYARLLKNRRMTTAVVTGSNLIEDAADVLGEYLQAFRDRGYAFEADAHIPDLHAFLAEKLSNGDIDLFIKEAHSDGDEKNLFRIFKTSELKVGRKKLPNGEEEVVYLIYPSPGASGNDASTNLISNAEFGQWMREREKVDVPLYYLNSSCWSSTKAKAEIQAAASPALVEIPSLTTMDEFTDEPGATMYETVFGFLDRKNFDELQAASLKDPSTKAGDNNILLWPSASDKERYLKEVLANFKQPVDIDVQVFDSQGRPYNIDQQP